MLTRLGHEPCFTSTYQGKGAWKNRAGLSIYLVIEPTLVRKKMELKNSRNILEDPNVFIDDTGAKRD